MSQATSFETLLTVSSLDSVCVPSPGNPYPPLRDDPMDNRNLLHNVLLDEARRQYRHKKYQRLAMEARDTLAHAETSAAEGAETSGDAAAADGAETTTHTEDAGHPQR